ncbi:GIN domain-containing protein [Gilvimarinus polysaccharolyticus]|uniref:GIN domain-containing protein n=1 Tax=Gilvimarinus polysaccharolyticus TaxID=863921 RepID=UPI0006731C9D|nr:DUF2807 domain-containing protein [Gilvimarinus polysaccharolyticus]
MNRLLAGLGQYALAAALLITVQTNAAEKPSTRISLQGISHLHLHGNIEVDLRQSDEDSAYILVEKGKLEDVTIKTDDDKLWLGNRARGFWSWFKNDNSSVVKVEINISTLNSINANGSVAIASGDITSGPLTLDLSGASQVTTGALIADYLQLDVSGAASFTAASVQAKTLILDASGASHTSITNGGTVNTLTLDISGASHYDGASVTAVIVNAEISGASQAKVKASQELSADISGASSLEYSGEPTVQLNTSGASNIKKL